MVDSSETVTSKWKTLVDSNFKVDSSETVTSKWKTVVDSEFK